MRESSIVLYPWEIRQTLQDLKTHLKRPIKPQPEMVADRITKSWDGNPETLLKLLQKAKRCPYEIGMKLWVKETILNIPEHGNFYYAADRKGVGEKVFSSLLGRGWSKKKTLPSIHMPRWAARIILEITDIKVQRVHDISLDDIAAEGLDQHVTTKVIEERAARNRAPYELWVSGGDEGISFCPNCIDGEIEKLRKENPGEEYGIGGNYICEGDGPVHCANCGEVLDNSYTDYGSESELDHFDEYGFDVNSREDCLSLEKILGSQGWDGPLAPRIRKLSYRAVWDFFNAARGFSWESNPYVWSIEYQLCKEV